MRRTTGTVALAALPLTLGLPVPTAPPPVAAVYIVSNTNDDKGAGSLRSAILLANQDPTRDEIHFDIPGGGVHRIALATDLPPIVHPVVVDGYTQPGAGTGDIGKPATLQIVIDASAVAYGLDLQTNDSVIAGLVVHSAAGPVAAGVTCDHHGICVTGHDNVIRGNHIGVDETGQPLGNDDGVHIEGDGNLVGGARAADRNVISANHDDGVAIEGAMNIVQGNLIGTDPDGTIALGNTGDGVTIAGNGNTVGGRNAGDGNIISGSSRGVYTNGDENTVAGNRIGTDADGLALLANGDGVFVLGVTNWVENNVIAGTGTGVTIDSGGRTVVEGNLIGTDITGRATFAGGGGDNGIVTDGTTGNVTIRDNVIAGMRIDGITLGGTASTVAGNKIGTDLNGTVALGNNTGLRVDGSNNTIGGRSGGTGNIISGNVTDGVVVESTETGNALYGNLIGVDITGLVPLGNGGYGVWIDGGGNALGGSGPGEGNVISANGSDGVRLDGSDNTVDGNLIGVDITGLAPLGNVGSGVLISDNANRVGGAFPGAGNAIGANSGHGINVESGTDNQIMANAIGTDLNGGIDLGNTGSGIFVGADRTVIGSIDQAVKPNMIAFNDNDGVTVDTTGTDNAIVRNVIGFNTGLGIDLRPNGVTPNDNNVQDVDVGANDLQNYPVISSASTLGTTTTVTWSLDSLSLSKFRVEFFAVNACDGSGHGQGRTFLGDQLVGTKPNGRAGEPTPTAIPAGVGQYVVMTATNVSVLGLGATSEFSACVQVT